MGEEGTFSQDVQALCEAHLELKKQLRRLFNENKSLQMENMQLKTDLANQRQAVRQIISQLTQIEDESSCLI